MTAQMKKMVLFFYLGGIAYLLGALLFLVLRGIITPGMFLATTTAQIGTLGALLIRSEPVKPEDIKADEVKVEGEDVTVTKTKGTK